MKKTINTFKNYKCTGEKITMVTSYDYSTAKMVDEAGIDAILVGDSLGMVMLGYKDTLAVTIDDMIHHGRAVVRGVKETFVVVDMPFMSYQTSVYDAVVNAGRIMKETGADAVKLEGGKSVCPQIRAITEAGIPVMAHIGLTPQSINTFGGFKVQGKSFEAAKQIMEDAKEIEKAGAFSIVLECVPKALAKAITESIGISTIGIGAGNECNGQILVYQDMLGMYGDFQPKFVKKFADCGSVMKQGFKDYIKEVKNSKFPSEEHCFKIDDSIIDKLY